MRGEIGGKPKKDSDNGRSWQVCTRMTSGRERQSFVKKEELKKKDTPGRPITYMGVVTSFVHRCCFSQSYSLSATWTLNVTVRGCIVWWLTKLLSLITFRGYANIGCVCEKKNQVKYLFVHGTNFFLTNFKFFFYCFLFLLLVVNQVVNIFFVLYRSKNHDLKTKSFKILVVL